MSNKNKVLLPEQTCMHKKGDQSCFNTSCSSSYFFNTLYTLHSIVSFLRYKHGQNDSDEKIQAY